MADYWFKPKTVGYGAAPTDWRGWALILGFGAAEVLLTFFMIGWPALKGEVPTVTQFILFLVLVILLTIGFLWLCISKTDGPWGWRKPGSDAKD
ncbi:MAG: hypothetical protein GYA66_07020 [Phyllobacteriaceae bacterium]|nr:hypothetical protein [Phyllobacteriaceae bacterium]